MSKFGSVTGTGAPINVSLGYKPAYVKVWNMANAGLATIEWTADQPDGTGLKTKSGVADTKLAGTGISVYPGTPGTGVGGTAFGFTIGADADINVAGQTIAFQAMHSGSGER